MCNRLTSMSRRSFLVNTAAFGIAASQVRRGLAADRKPTFAYFGTNTVPGTVPRMARVSTFAEVDAGSGRSEVG